MPPLYNGLPNSSSYGGYTNGGYNSPVGTINELTDLFNDLSFDCKPTKRPPPSYLCHLCFKKGHYIKDCPQVRIFSYITQITFMFLFLKKGEKKVNPFVISGKYWAFKIFNFGQYHF